MKKNISFVIIIMLIIGFSAEKNIRGDERSKQSAKGPYDMGLIRASKKGDINKVKKYLSKGSNINCEDTDGNSPLLCAIESKNNKLIKYIISSGARVNSINTYGITPLMAAIENYDHSRDKSYSIGLLIEKGAHLNVSDQCEKSILQYGVSSGDIDLVKKLILKGAKVNKNSKNGDSVLMTAIREKDIDIVSYLLSKGASVNKAYNQIPVKSKYNLLDTMNRKFNFELQKFLFS